MLTRVFCLVLVRAGPTRASKGSKRGERYNKSFCRSVSSRAFAPWYRLPPCVDDSSIRLIFRERLIVLLIIGGMVRFMAGFAIGSYLPDFYSEVFSEYNTVCEWWIGGLGGMTQHR